jgi:hypothetical protein
LKHSQLSAPAALLGLLVAAIPVSAQSPASPPSSEARIEAAAQAFEKDPQFRLLSPKKRQDLVKFVIGNTLFALVHEFGHATISEMGLPVLGREEDAADAFAAVVGLKMGTKMSQGVLIEATKGWFYADRRDSQEGNKMAFYDEHGNHVLRDRR